MATGWQEAGDIAQLVAAGATTILAGFTAWLAFTTRQLGRRAGDEASATKQLAYEAATDRELAWRPILQVTSREGATSGGTGWTEPATVHNIGLGPALDCACLLGYQGVTVSSGSFALAAGGEHDVTLRSTGVNREDADGVMTATPGGAWRGDGRRWVVVCTDVLNRRWRFPQGLPSQVSAMDDERNAYWTKWRP